MLRFGGVFERDMLSSTEDFIDKAATSGIANVRFAIRHISVS